MFRAIVSTTMSTDSVFVTRDFDCAQEIWLAASKMVTAMILQDGEQDDACIFLLLP
jgi:hypothetical protein